MRQLLITWAILRLIWEAKGYSMKEMPGILLAKWKGRQGLAFSSLQRKAKNAKAAPDDVTDFITDEKTLPTRQGHETTAKLLQLGMAALSGNAAPDPRPADGRPTMNQARPTMRGWLSRKLDALASSAFSLLAQLTSAETKLKAALALITSKLDALASTVASKLDALASSLGSLLTMLTGVRRTLDAVDGKLDNVLGTLGQVAATVNHVDAKGDLAEYARARETRRVIRTVRRVGASVRWLGRAALVGFVAVMFVLAVSGRVRWAHDEEPAAASVTQPPAPVVVVVNGATGTLVDLREYLGAIAQFGKKVEEKRIPTQPLPFQKDKDCNPDLGEVAINGGCWAKMDVAPPCKLLFRHGDACYRPVAADPTKPVGMLPDTSSGQQ